jgi:hypothetical protein
MIFEDLLSLLNQTEQMKEKGVLTTPFFFTQELDYLDQVWHEFIIHTHDYFDYCMNTFGKYLHHSPTLQGETQSEGSYTHAEVAEQIDLLIIYAGKDFVNRIFFLYPEIIKNA